MEGVYGEEGVLEGVGICLKVGLEGLGDFVLGFENVYGFDDGVS